MKFISYQDIRERAPAAFAESPAPGLSARYRFISTLQVINQLGDLGWYPAAASQSRSKYKQHATHLITFRQLEHRSELEVGDMIAQLMFVNNHGGKRSSELLSGFEKLACKNGLTIATGLFEERLVQIHLGGDVGTVIEQAVSRAQEALKTASTEVDGWRGVVLNQIEQLAFADSALRLRYPDAFHRMLSAAPLLERQRDVDQKDDLWTVFNVVQENLLRGGVRGVFSVRRSIRKVTAISPLQTINQKLWSLAQRFAIMFKRSKS